MSRRAVILLMLLALPALAEDLWTSADGMERLAFDISFKATTLVSHAPDDPLLYPEPDNVVGLGRLRLAPSYHWEGGSAHFAYEHRASGFDEARTLGLGTTVLPDLAGSAFRLEALEWQVDADDHYDWRHGIDRAFVSLRPEWGEVVVGRQAIGLGRGVVFNAVDIFAPFSPLEVDREWRAGVDAIRAEYRFGPTSSAEAIVAGGSSWEESAALGRVRGYLGLWDAELIAGKRARDELLGLVASGVVGEAEVHGEAALFRLPADEAAPGLYQGFGGDDRLVAKAVLGGSYTFNVGQGLTLLGEYHYNGFGVSEIQNATAALARAEVQRRFLRGDFQTPGRHATALRLSYPWTMSWRGDLLFLVSPEDGSGVIQPTVAWDFARSASLLLSVTAPWGAGPEDGRLQSQYGGSANTLFCQLRWYY